MVDLSMHNLNFGDDQPTQSMGSISLSPRGFTSRQSPSTSTFNGASCGATASQQQQQHSQSGKPQMMQEMSNSIAGSLAMSAAEQSMGLLRKGAGKIRVYIERNHYSVHALSLIGGLALVVLSTVGLLNVAATLTGPLSYILHLYQVGFGIIICVIDGPGEKVPRAQAFVVQYAPFLHNNLGRSLFYLFLACLEGSQNAWLHNLLGWYFLAISVMHIALKFKSLGMKGADNGEDPRANSEFESAEHAVGQELLWLTLLHLHLQAGCIRIVASEVTFTEFAYNWLILASYVM